MSGGGGFQWNLVPGGGATSGDESAADPAATEAGADHARTDDGSYEPEQPTQALGPEDLPPPRAEPPPTEAIALEDLPSPPDGPKSADDPATADEESDSQAYDPWDVPTVASLVVPRSVFPLPPPTGQPVALPPPVGAASAFAFAPPPLVSPPPTEHMDFAGTPPPFDDSLRTFTEVVGAQQVGLPKPQDEAVEASDIDSLFGDNRFVDYDESEPFVGRQRTSTLAAGPDRFGPPSRTAALVHQPAKPPSRASAPRGMSRAQKALIGSGVGVLAALVVLALFLLGTRIGQQQQPEAAAVPPAEANSDSAPAAVPAPDAPAEAGDRRWNELGGGECLSPFESAWQDTYTVVDCGGGHPAQLLTRGQFPEAADAAFPGAEALQTQVGPLCSDPAVLDYAAAENIDDIQLDASYPADEAQWDAGDRSYYCFVSREGGRDLTTSLAAAAG